ncbi:hypothetical protein [Lacrimispora celerecrescens]|uniref:Uncharacterized protein n=1 Tax=Lacrimispora celerecrescens TaxID=29354 RepID=A0A084JMD2_9FIRM|nr:hypothetical protein [Lacrimispora celerecrescens]KEZ90116.1 hypothetical protein IO98_11550 [Lacrimispora celerecrescens]
MNEYEKIEQMNHQIYIMKKNKKTVLSKWRKSREFIEAVLKTLSQHEEKLKDALEFSIKALLTMQVQEENSPLKKSNLVRLDGEPVWVVSYDHDGRWGIVNTINESILFPTNEGIKEEGWFDGMYIFRYKKNIKDYSQILEKYNLKDE